MASEKPLSAGAKRQPLVGLEGDLWLPSSGLHPGEPRTDSYGSGSWSSSPAAFQSSPHGHLHPAALSTFPDGAQDPEAMSLKPVRGFFPPSWKRCFRRWWRRPGGDPSPLTYSPGFRNSPPVTPVLEGPQRTHFDGEDGSSSSDRKDEEDWKKPPSDATTSSKSGRTVTATSHGGTSTALPSYKEKLEAYDHKYAYLKSWPGLLRLLGGLELILGGMVFACTAAYIQKDYQWSELYGNGFLPYNSLTGMDYGYYGPMTPFVLVVASLVWLVTVILLGLGVTMYYQTILLNAHWWPLTEFALNLFMFLLYLAAAIAYVNDVNRGGLCYSVFAYNPLITALCRVEGGQVAAITFLFLTMLLYLTGSLVCLKMWRHEAARRMLAPPNPLLPGGASQHTAPRGEGRPAGRVTRRVAFSEPGGAEGLNNAIPTGHNPKPLIVPDYIVRYPAIRSLDEREKYKAVFNDQYLEYRELFREIRATRQKFQELDALMSQLPAHPQNKEEQSRVSAVWREYRSKKKDPAFLEQQERCQYLWKQISYLKAQIQAFDADTSRPSLFF
ncbi:MARVEL domain-containing protein 2-like [Python bivittatus]|uniref:MARVEL domain-containing protein 2-like n=1 Tax=Python bivittatus TaxID=176946 RepID=A0A9F5J605_PYTBI|nr:MARVEL domain-containing protein 2-like [Python bivittatus]XP_025030494.1 MARVEL domain-containing protein 2-like [Python bivittatus]